jgi:thioredoxin-like negative regulator of GroEL
VAVRSASLPQLETARRALAEGRYETAFALLEDAARQPRDRAQRALLHLHLAAADALYGVDGLDRGLQALRQAAASDPAAVGWPLYRALHWEFRALQGAAAGEVRRGVAGVEPVEPVAAYHAASALWRAGAGRSARRALQAIDAGRLPAYLRWRHAALLGHAHAEAGAWAEAAEAFQAAEAGTTPPERAGVRAHRAGALLEDGRVELAAALLEGLPRDDLTPSECAWVRQLEGRADLELGNPERALARLAEAEAGAPDAAARFAAVQLAAQALARLGRHVEAAERLASAQGEAPEAERPYALHERAVALLEADLAEQAEGVLEELLLDPDYPHRGEATADLAEARLRQGDLAGAREIAGRALELGATGPACLTLGTVAFEYYELDDAVRWLEQAASASGTGDPAWVAAQQLLADVFAQRGPAAAERLLSHARQALAWTEPGSEWVGPLEAHVAQARAWLGGHERWLN